MDKGIFTNDGSFMERFKQMQQEAQEKKAAAASASSAPKHANPKQGFAVAANKRPFELKNAAPVASAGKLAFSLKKAKVAVAPVFAADEEDEDAVDVEREEPAKRQKSVQADAPAAAAPSGAVGNYLYLLISCCFTISLFSEGVLWVVVSNFSSHD
jgi:splicing factor 4